MANFRGTGHRIGKSAKQRMKHAAAATLQAPKTRSRSHRLTDTRIRYVSRRSPLEGRRVEGGYAPAERLHDLMHVITTAVQELVSHHKRFKLEVGRLTGKESLFLFSPAGSRQRGTWSLIVCGKPHGAFTPKRVQGLQPGQDGRRGGVDRDVGITSRPAHGAHRVLKGCRRHG